jgi:hypothetical protein
MKRWGAITAAEIAAWQEFLLATGAIRNRRSPSDYFSAALVDRFEAFEAAAVVTQAKTAR